MKKVAFTIVALSIVTLFTACKEETPETPVVENNKELVAIADTAPKTQYLYVTAPSGLTLREFNNLNSEKLAVMPYGTKLEVLTSETNKTMTVAGVAGGMNQVTYNNKTGFAFNGFLSKFFPPEKNSNAKMYVEDLRATFPDTSFTETTGGTASKPSNTQTIILPTQNWHEAFYIAQQLYEIPMTFGFPNPKGTIMQTIQNKKMPVQLSVSELKVERNDTSLEKITYLQAAEAFKSSVLISKEAGNMKIEYSTVVE